jgi:protein TonB
MPLNVRRFNTSVLLVLLSFIFAGAQSPPPQTAATSAVIPPGPPTSGDVMRERISKSKAYIAVRNYNAAIYELENLRRETADPSVHGVANVLLMNSYLEQGDYKRAQAMLNEFYGVQKTTKPGAGEAYMSVAGQIIKGARSRADRYKALGLDVADRTLPLEALNDLEKMRETLELVITQAKEMGADRSKAPVAMVMLEEAAGSRSMLARDDYDSRRWRDELADTRERLAMSGSVVTAVSGEVPMVGVPVAATPKETLVADNTPVYTPASAQPAVISNAVAEEKLTTPSSVPADRPIANSEPKPEFKPVQTGKPVDAKTEPPKQPETIYVRSAPPTPKETPKTSAAEPEAGGPAEEKKPEAVAELGPVDAGSLLPFATSRSNPVYPPAAKTIRATGVVRVEIMINENGEVADVQRASGHAMLQSAAKDAVRKWKFKPFMRDGQPVKATGFVNFNFSL